MDNTKYSSKDKEIYITLLTKSYKIISTSVCVELVFPSITSLNPSFHNVDITMDIGITEDIKVTIYNNANQTAQLIYLNKICLIKYNNVKQSYLINDVT